MADKNNFDVAVIGAGPAGMMAAITAARLGASVALLERNERPGRKLLLTGKGRCNITNAEFDLRKLVANYGQGGPFLFHAFSIFGPKAVIDFFEAAGVATIIEDKQRVFPKSMKSQDVLDALARQLAELRVRLLFDTTATGISKKGGLISSVRTAATDVTAKKYIIATGGKSYIGTGSTGDGYEWAHYLGHRIEKLAPALVPIKTKDVWAKKLAGVGLENIRISVESLGKKVMSLTGDVLFTYFGLSGPAILDISARVGDLLAAGETKIVLDIMPQLRRDEFEKEILQNFSQTPNRALKNCLAVFMPQNLALAVCELAIVDPEMSVNNVTMVARRRLVDTIKNVALTVVGLMDIESGMVTAGGVANEFIDDKTMRSKIINNLFFAGEIINVHGRTGGFNLQQCWSTGYLAGASAASCLAKRK